MKELVTQKFEFMNHEVEAVEQDGMWYFSPRRICENIGLVWAGQQTKIRSEMDKFSCIDIYTTGKDGKHYKMLVIPASRIDTWILNINRNKVKKEARSALKDYQDKLSDWLHARNFLTKEEEAQVITLAKERGANIKLSLDEKRDKVLVLPEEYTNYKQDRVALITDVMIGKESPQLLGESSILTRQAFYKDYVIEGCCDDKMIIRYPDFATPKDVEDYAQQEGILRESLYCLPMSFTLMSTITKAHRMFRRTIADLVIHYNLPAQSIRYAINWVEHWLAEYFAARQVILAESTRETQKEIYRNYMNDPLWHQKRDAYFSVYNCCVDCGKWEIVSKNFTPHHLHYMTVGEEHPSDLVPLCSICHGIREEKYRIA
jgi:hypothetical protein